MSNNDPQSKIHILSSLGNQNSSNPSSALLLNNGASNTTAVQPSSLVTPAVAEPKDELTIRYILPIKESDQGFVFDMPIFNYDGNGNQPKFEDVELTDIFKAIIGDDHLKTILGNRSDTNAGIQTILAAQQQIEAKRQSDADTAINENATSLKINAINAAFSKKLLAFQNATNDVQFEPILSSADALPSIDDVTFKSRLSLLIEAYNMLLGVIEADKLFQIGQYSNDGGYSNVDHFKRFKLGDFSNANSKLNLAAFLFYVAKTFMRIPIVLLTASTDTKEVVNEPTIYKGEPFQPVENTSPENSINFNHYDYNVGLYETLKSNIYPNEINDETNPAFNKTLKIGISSNDTSKDIYMSYVNSNVKIGFDMLCYLLMGVAANAQTNTNNYDYFVVAFCERLIYIINYWCSKGEINNLYGDDQRSSRLGQLHYSTVKVTDYGKTYDEKGNLEKADKKRTFSSILQKIHNKNDNLITFVKIRKGRTNIKPGDNTKTENDGITMNIRYTGINDQFPNVLSLDDRILQFRYIDTVEPLYNQVGLVDYNSNSSGIQNSGKEPIYVKIFEKYSASKDEINPGNAKGNAKSKMKFEQINAAKSKFAGPFLYNHDFNLGPFSYIYNEKQDNEKIAKSHIFRQTILNKLLDTSNDIPVCIIGYGASGSGKTSVLIQLSAPNEEPQPGLLMHMSDELAINGYITCNVNIVEFDNKNTKGMDGVFVGQYKYAKKWTGRCSFGDNKTKTFGSMFEDILEFMDMQRNVQKTPNNPVSSRSHVIIHLKYFGNSKTKHLFICDLAGVENMFDCANIKSDVEGASSFLTAIEESKRTETLYNDKRLTLKDLAKSSYADMDKAEAKEPIRENNNEIQVGEGATVVGATVVGDGEGEGATVVGDGEDEGAKRVNVVVKDVNVVVKDVNVDAKDANVGVDAKDAKDANVGVDAKSERKDVVGVDVDAKDANVGVDAKSERKDVVGVDVDAKVVNPSDFMYFGIPSKIQPKIGHIELGTSVRNMQTHMKSNELKLKDLTTILTDFLNDKNIHSAPQYAYIDKIKKNLEASRSFTYLNYKFPLGNYYGAIKEVLTEQLPKKKIETIFDFIVALQGIKFKEREFDLTNPPIVTVTADEKNYKYELRENDFSRKTMTIEEMTANRELLPFYDFDLNAVVSRTNPYKIKLSNDERHVKRYDTTIKTSYEGVRDAYTRLIWASLQNSSQATTDRISAATDVLAKSCKKIVSKYNYELLLTGLSDGETRRKLIQNYDPNNIPQGYPSIEKYPYYKLNAATRMPGVGETYGYDLSYFKKVTIPTMFPFLQDKEETDEDTPLEFRKVVFLVKVKNNSLPNAELTSKCKITYNVSTPNKITVTASHAETVTTQSIKEFEIGKDISFDFTRDQEKQKIIADLKKKLKDFDNTNIYADAIYYRFGDDVDDVDDKKKTIPTPTLATIKDFEEKLQGIPYKQKYTVKIPYSYIKAYFDDVYSTVTGPKYEPIIEKLYQLEYGKTSPVKPEFILGLKDKFLRKFNEKYDVFQLQVLFEQIMFSEPENYGSSGFLDKDIQDPKKSDGSLIYTSQNLDTLSSRKSTSIMTGGGGRRQEGGDITRREGLREFFGGEPVGYVGNSYEKYSTLCSTRVEEGKYINSFLKNMREGIAKYIMKRNNKSTPSFFSKCLPMQCNPEFKECLGIDNYPMVQGPSQNKKSDDDYGELVNKVTELLGGPGSKAAQNVVFCVFCVFNMSEPPLVVEPPPVHYIDITKLQQHFEILKNSTIETFRDPASMLKLVVTDLSNIIKSQQFGKLNQNDESVKSIIGAPAYINGIILNEDLLSRYKTNPSPTNNLIKTCIDYISNINAATPIGTLLFTDSVAKNFVDVNTCDLKQKISQKDDAKSINEYKYPLTGGGNKTQRRIPKRNNRITKRN